MAPRRGRPRVDLDGRGTGRSRHRASGRAAAPGAGVGRHFPFGGSHHQVPGVVAVNHAPYYCVPHQRAFRERADFVVHLRTHHGLTDDEIRRVVLVVRGQVRYVGN